MNQSLFKFFTLIALIIGFSFIVTVQYQGAHALKSINDPSSILESTSSIADPNTPTKTPTEWQTISSNNLGFSIKYPTDVLVNQGGDGSIIFIKVGPYQKTTSALDDGLVVTFNSGNYTEANLMQYVEKKQADLQKQPFVDKVGIINQIDLAGITGYQFTVSSVNNTSFIFLPESQNSYFIITSTIEDPFNMGYDELLQSMLSTLELEIIV